MVRPRRVRCRVAGAFLATGNTGGFMLVRIIQSHVLNDGSFAAGQTLDLPAELAKEKIDCGFAVPVAGSGVTTPERSNPATNKRETR